MGFFCIERAREREFIGRGRRKKGEVREREKKTKERRPKAMNERKKRFALSRVAPPLNVHIDALELEVGVAYVGACRDE